MAMETHSYVDALLAANTTYASTDARRRHVNAIDVARRFGAVVVSDGRTRGCTMASCVQWLVAALIACGCRSIRQMRVSDALALRGFRGAVFCFANLWACAPNPAALRSSQKFGTLWVAIQTEHKGYRVYVDPKTHYTWFLQAAGLVWDFGVDFCERTAGTSVFFPAMWVVVTAPQLATLLPPSRRPVDVALLGKRSTERVAVVRDLVRRGKVVDYRDGLGVQETLTALRRAKIGIMIPRQPGNFEVHRFATLVAAGVHVVCVHLPAAQEAVQAVFAPAVTFCDLGDVPAVVHELLGAPKELDARVAAATAWFASSGIADGTVLAKLTTALAAAQH